MGWTKHADAVRLMDKRRSKLRRRINTLAKADTFSLDEAWAVAFEYEKIDRALARGHQDGSTASGLGVSLNSKPARLGALVRDLISTHEEFTFVRKDADLDSH